MKNRFKSSRHRLLCLVTVVVLAASGAAASGASDKPAFRDFNGVNLLPGPPQVKQLGIGWAREGFYWSNIEPKKGVWSWSTTDQKVLGAHAEGVQILPIVAYNTPWDESISGNGFSPPKNVPDWEDYVEHLVSRYSASPYNLRYFEVWNEPTHQAGFWTGTDQQFVDDVYLPAAKIIRSHHCFVVFGGWPTSNSLQEYDSVLAYHDAWRWTDILNVHYEGLPYWQHLYARWVRTEKCRGLWETEVTGYDPESVPSIYVPMLHWSLATGWTFSDQYKLFWYAAWGAGPDARECLTTTDAKKNIVLTVQGTRMAVLSKVLGGGPLTAFRDYQITPARLRSATFGFKAGRRIVVVMLLNKSGILHLPLLGIRIAAPGTTRVELIDGAGSSVNHTVRFYNGYQNITISLQQLARETGNVTAAYAEIDPADSKR